MYWFTCSIKCYTDMFTKFKCYKWLCKYALCTRQWLFYHRFYFLCSSALHSCWSMRSVGNLTSQQWSRLVLLEVQGFWRHLVLSCAAGWTDGPAGSQSGKMNVRKVGTICNCLSASLPLPTSRTSTRNRRFESSDACRASSLPALLRFQPGVTAALLLAANDGSSTRWQCSSGTFGSAEAAPVLTQQDLNTTKAHLNSKKKSLGRKSRDEILLIV